MGVRGLILIFWGQNAHHVQMGRVAPQAESIEYDLKVEWGARHLSE